MGSPEANHSKQPDHSAQYKFFQAVAQLSLAWGLFGVPGASVAHAQQNPDLCPQSPSLSCTITSNNYLKIEGEKLRDQLLPVVWTQIVPQFCPPGTNGGDVFTAIEGVNGVTVSQGPNGGNQAEFKKFGTGDTVCVAPLEELLQIIDTASAEADGLGSPEPTSTPPAPTQDTAPPAPTEPIVDWEALDPAGTDERVVRAAAEVGLTGAWILSCTAGAGLLAAVLASLQHRANIIRSRQQSAFKPAKGARPATMRPKGNRHAPAVSQIRRRGRSVILPEKPKHARYVENRTEDTRKIEHAQGGAYAAFAQGDLENGWRLVGLFTELMKKFNNQRPSNNS